MRLASYSDFALRDLRGKPGGIRLARPAEEISIGSLSRCMEANLHLTECFEVPE